MINIKDKSLCSGCFACSSKCPVKAINMVQDNEGFYYPKVNEDKCGSAAHSENDDRTGAFGNRY